jgi:hypothetical protein
VTTESQQKSLRPIRRTRKSIKVEKAVVLRSQGKTWEEIAHAMGWKSKAVASNFVYHYLSDQAKKSEATVEAYREELIEKLDELEKECWAVLKRKHITVQNGKVVQIENEETGEYSPVEDDAPVLQAADRILKIIERKAKLMGVDLSADTQIGVAVQYTVQGTEIGDYQ